MDKNYIYTINFVESECEYNEETEEYIEKIISDKTDTVESDIEDMEYLAEYYFYNQPHCFGVDRGDWKHLLKHPTQKDKEKDLLRFREYGGYIDWTLTITRKEKKEDL